MSISKIKKPPLLKKEPLVEEEEKIAELNAVVIKKEEESIPSDTLLAGLRVDDAEDKKEDVKPQLKTKENQYFEPAGKEAESICRPVRHPRLPSIKPARYHVNKHGDVYSRVSGELKLMKERKGTTASYDLYTGNGKKTSFKLEEIIAYTFYDDFDSSTQYIFHRDGRQFNCSLNNLVLCNLEKLQELEINRNQELNDGAKYTVVKNVHDTFTFNRYLVSDTGYIYSIFKRRYLLPYKSEIGYLCVSISPDTPFERFNMAVHQIVMQSFSGRRPVGNIKIDHIDGSKLNNALSNLEYVTGSENTRRAFSPEQTSMRASLKNQGIFTEKVNARPLPPITEETIWNTIGVIPWIGVAFNNYQVSEMGHVRRKDSPKLLSQQICSGKYPRVTMRCDKQQPERDNLDAVPSRLSNSILVSRVVAITFVSGYSETKNIVKHLNGDTQDNRAENLQWVDRATGSRCRTARMVIVTSADDPASEKKFPSISKAERELNVYLRHEIKKGSVFEKEVDWDGVRKVVSIKVM